MRNCLEAAARLNNQMLKIFIQTTNKYARTAKRGVCTSPRRCSVLPQLTPYDVNCILRENEYSHSFPEGSVKGYDSNQLGSNSPIEDSRSEASFLHQKGFLCGIFDGHGGPSCSQVISKRLMRYIAASILNKDVLRKEMLDGGTSQSFLKCHNDKLDFVKEIRALYEESFRKYTEELCNGSTLFTKRRDAIQHAFLKLDSDLSREALEHPSPRTLSVAMSGAVACVAYIEGCHLYIASTGDCSAVLGTLSSSGKWVAKKLTQEHNTDNIREVQRILSEHPLAERDTVIRNERLLGQLMPLRALGDFRYKWSNEIMDKVVVPNFGEANVPPYYYTPPYLTALPDITHHMLDSNDQFLVVASDGLWDFLSPSQVVDLVSEHLSAKEFLQPLKLPHNGITLGEIAEILEHRKAGRKKKPLDKNAATHLIRNALGGTEYGVEHSKLSHLLSLSQDVVRLYRDDITITIIYFDQKVLSNQ